MLSELVRATHRLRTLSCAVCLAVGSVVVLGGCGRESMSTPPCTTVESAIPRQELPATDPVNLQPVVTLTVVEHFLQWQGDLDCLLLHEGGNQSWVTISFKNVGQSTVSFDYTITGVIQPVSGSVNALAPGAVLPNLPFCIMVACGGPPYPQLAVELHNVRYGP